MRFALCLAAFGACSLFGFILGGGLDKRCRALSGLIMALDALHGALRYLAEPVGHALGQTGQRLRGEAGSLFLAMAKGMEQGLDCPGAFSQALIWAKGDMAALIEADRDILLDLSAGLGLDKARQADAFALCLERLNRQKARAEDDRKGRGRLMRVSGSFLGALIFILFI